MKKRLLLSMAVLGSATMARADIEDNVVGKTHYTVEGVYNSVAPEHLTGYRDRMLVRPDGFGGAFQVTVFGGKTRKSDHLGRYFYPVNKSELVVSEAPRYDSGDSIYVADSGGAAFLDDTYDVLANHFDIRTVDGTFQSTIQFRPRQSFVGGAFSWRQELWTKDDETKGLWFEAILPVVHVKNRLGFSETVANTGDGVSTDSDDIQGTNEQPNMTAAFNRDALCNGQVLIDGCAGSASSTSCKTTRGDCSSSCASGTTCNVTCTPDNDSTALANAELLAWFDYVRADDARFGSCLGVVFPTSDKADSSRAIFAPISGSRHWGLEWGHTAGFTMWSGDEWTISAAFDLRSFYLFKRNECRTFDLVGKPWSRYMRFHASETAATEQYTDSALAPKAGSCYTTFNVSVHPRTRHEVNTGLLLDWKKFQAEVGYHLTARQSERIELCTDSTTFDFGIAGGENTRITANTQSAANIRQWGLCITSDDKDYSSLAGSTCTGADYAFKAVKVEDIDLQSAAHPSTISHKVYGSLSYRFDDMEYPLFVNAGGAYTFSADNTSVTRWSVWGKIGLSI